MREWRMPPPGQDDCPDTLTWSASMTSASLSHVASASCVLHGYVSGYNELSSAPTSEALLGPTTAAALTCFFLTFSPELLVAFAVSLP